MFGKVLCGMEIPENRELSPRDKLSVNIIRKPVACYLAIRTVFYKGIIFIDNKIFDEIRNIKFVFLPKDKLS